MTQAKRIGIVGAGAIGLGTAALLHRNQHVPILWSPSGESTRIFETESLSVHGVFEAEFAPEIAGSAEELVQKSDALLLALPATGHKAVMDSLAPYIRDGQHILISSHASFGALYLTKRLAERGVAAPVTAWGTTIVSGRRTDSSVRVNTVRGQVDLCTVPETDSQAALELCQNLFGDRFTPRDGLLAITLSNLNPQNHLGIALCNITRMERGEDWSQGLNVTPKVGRLMEKLDLERLEIAKALGLNVKTIFEHFHKSFHVPVGPISEMNQEMHRHGYGGLGPNTADSRYVTEDVPYGLAVTAVLGRMVGKPAVLHEAGIEIFSAMYDRDFTQENAFLDDLNLSQHTLNDLQEAARTGLLPQASVTA
ncbi:NAD/NADP octopine/nopaline dehydrogenase family protein [Celeribacter litoreus]|uniref:NAD/NADP octopine/nopaline dehydrogenase family protein n=1 Tax=Celeribacter litoreus TaxID=2876714 RepID=UPI001CD03406|nr:NAD/NADP octopine/nopaline dehydrogenase family protein [Celeribacter litoreus]MCA0044765.1 NAD/NADP octopine/nopaline dehydrogenase family protein [Celeribacter litoreus]